MNEIFEPFEKSSEISFCDFNDCTISLEGARRNQIVFYKNRNDQRSSEIFRSRLSCGRPGLLVLINRPSFELSVPHIVVPEAEFLKVQRLTLKKLFELKRVPKLAAVTGTNGKTTTAFLLMQLLHQSGLKAGFAGTIGVYINNKKIPHSFNTTSPGLIDLWKLVYENQDLDVLCLEASSHALDQDRFFGFSLDVAAFTNFSRDHLDYHKSFEAYFDAKRKIFNYLKDSGECFLTDLQIKVIDQLHDSRVKKVKLLSIDLENIFFRIRYNLENLTLAKEMSDCILGRHVKYDYKRLIPPPGRLDLISRGKDSFVAVDFAHTPDAVENVISEVRASFPEHGIKVVFGCGGNRDKKKRELMGEIVSGLSDFFYITNDNPRDESPDEIIEDIKVGVIDNSSYVIEKDRRLAIISAIKSMGARQIVLILGKGHEDYQIAKGKKTYFNDKEIVLEYLKNDENKN